MIAAPLRCLLAGLLVVSACGGEPPAPPPPPPQEFDDPFADDAKAEGPAEVALAAKPENEAPAPAPGLAGDSTGAPEPAGTATDAPASALAGNATAAPEPTPEPTADPAPATAVPAVAPAKTERAAKPKAATEPAPKDKPKAPPSQPVPADSPPPTPAPAPAPEPAPAPAPVAEPAPPPAPVKPPEPAQKRFVGTYRFAGGDAQRQALTSAIETAAQELNALIRGIGRKRLTEANPIRETITIAVDGDRVTTTFGPGRSVTGTLGGPAVPWTSDSGKAVSVAFTLVKGRLVQTYTADDGGRRSVYTLDDTGDRLTLSVTVTSDRLTNPLKYALTYKRSN